MAENARDGHVDGAFAFGDALTSLPVSELRRACKLSCAATCKLYYGSCSVCMPATALGELRRQGVSPNVIHPYVPEAVGYPRDRCEAEFGVGRLAGANGDEDDRLPKEVKESMQTKAVPHV